MQTRQLATEFFDERIGKGNYILEINKHSFLNIHLKYFYEIDQKILDEFEEFRPVGVSFTYEFSERTSRYKFISSKI